MQNKTMDLGAVHRNEKTGELEGEISEDELQKVASLSPKSS